MKAVTHVIFDVDGLLIDSERVYTSIMDILCEEYGKKFTWAIKVQLMGMKESDSAKRCIELLDLPLTVDEYLGRMKQMQIEHMPSVNFLPGAEKLVRHLHAKGIPIAVATGSNEWTFALKTTNHKEFFTLFDHCVLSGSDPEVKNGKPAPDIFLVAAKRFSTGPAKPEKTLVFEDAPHGVESGLAAGMQVVWCPDPNVDRSSLQDRVTLTLDTLEHFKPEQFGLPAYD